MEVLDKFISKWVEKSIQRKADKLFFESKKSKDKPKNDLTRARW